MKDITTLLSEAANGDLAANNELLPLVYEELKQMASNRMSHERSDHTLNATALVHEAYIRLVGETGMPGWENRGHFFSAAAEAMRRILVENARRKSRQKRGGAFKRIALTGCGVSMDVDPIEVIAISEALARLEQEDDIGAQLVKLRYFAGLSIEEAGNALGFSRAAAYRHWNFAKAWLQCELADLVES